MLFVIVFYLDATHGNDIPCFFFFQVLKISPNKEKIHFQMAVLSALTSTCGHIFLLSWNQQLSLEKALLFDRRVPDKHDSGSCHPSDTKTLDEGLYIDFNFYCL